jgi:hypothetical protein
MDGMIVSGKIPTEATAAVWITNRGRGHTLVRRASQNAAPYGTPCRAAVNGKALDREPFARPAAVITARRARPQDQRAAARGNPSTPAAPPLAPPCAWRAPRPACDRRPEPPPCALSGRLAILLPLTCTSVLLQADNVWRPEPAEAAFVRHSHPDRAVAILLGSRHVPHEGFFVRPPIRKLCFTHGPQLLGCRFRVHLWLLKKRRREARPYRQEKKTWGRLPPRSGRLR